MSSQSGQYNQSKQSQSSASRGNIYKETDQELGISGYTGTTHTSEEAIFENNQIKEQHETMKLQNES